MLQTQRMSKPNFEIPKTPIKFLIYASKPFKGYVLAAFTAVIIAAVLGQSTALLFKWIVEAIESGQKEKVLFLGLMYPVAILVVQLIYRISGFLGMNWIINAKKYASDTLFSYAAGHSHSYFSNRFAGSLLNKIGNVVGSVDSLVHDFLWSYLSTFVSLFTTLFYIFTVDVFSGLIFLALIITILIVNLLLMERKKLLSRRGAESNSKLRGVIVDVFSNISAVRQFGTRAQEEDYAGSLSKEWRDNGKASWTHSELVLVLNSVILFVFTFVMFLFLSHRWDESQITTAEFVFILALITNITSLLIFMGRSMTIYARVIGEAQEGLDEIIVPYEIVDVTNAKTLKLKKASIDWVNVDFTFDNNQVFDNFDLRIKPHERIGLVGHSGAGKTTFVSLLLRQHDLDGGAILIDEQNIAEVTQDSLRQSIAVVPQEPLLFHRTIRENIAYGNPKATKKQVEAAAKKAQAHDFIMNLPEQYDTLVGERGIKLSGGQKQRIAIARAILKDAPILVLDEATSALDSESEVAIQKALEELMKGKTVIAVAHRLSTLRKMDRIIVLENGKIIEDGNHDTLAKGGKTYQKLWEHQAGGFLQE
jgi:ATP-binding cassette, subfamily B, bacterial